MELAFKDELALMPDLRGRLRQLRWFRTTFRNNARAVGDHFGMTFRIDEGKLTRVFLDWIETVNRSKDYARVDRADFIVFAAGLALKELIRQKPVRAAASPAATPGSAPKAAIESDIVRFWPEGFLYTNYCVCAIAALFEQEFGSSPVLDACANDLRTWWSYRENTGEMPAFAIAFLDRFFGGEPNWIAPERVEERQAMRVAPTSLSGGGDGRLPSPASGMPL